MSDGGVYTRLLNIARHGQITVAPVETGVQQRVQVSVLATGPTDLGAISHFGLASSLPIGTDVLIINMEGDSKKGTVIGSNHQSFRPKNMLAGETMLYDNAKQAIYLQGGKSIGITAVETIMAIAPKGFTANVGTGDQGMTVNGDLNVNGNLKVTGKITATGDIVAGTVSLQQHVHGDVESGSGNSGPPVA